MALAAFVRHISGWRDVPRLVLLGDLFDLPDHVPGAGARAAAIAAWEDAGLETLAAILARHTDLVAALRQLGGLGAGIDLIPGNHDLLLARTRVRAALEQATGPLAVHPWLLYVPGVLYAEHGQQYHELNTVWTLLDPDPRGRGAAAPPAWALERMAGRRLPGRAWEAAGLLGGALRSQAALPRLRRERAAYRERVLGRGLETEGGRLAADLLVALDGLAETTPLDASLAAARRVLGRRRGEGSPFAYLAPAAHAIDQLLSEHALRVPVMVFGHTHAPAIEPLGPDPGMPVVANAGTWGRLRPAAAAARIGPSHHPFLVVGPRHDGRIEVGLRLWDTVRERDERYGTASVAP